MSLSVASVTVVSILFVTFVTLVSILFMTFVTSVAEGLVMMSSTTVIEDLLESSSGNTYR